MRGYSQSSLRDGQNRAASLQATELRWGSPWRTRVLPPFPAPDVPSGHFCGVNAALRHHPPRHPPRRSAGAKPRARQCSPPGTVQHATSRIERPFAGRKTTAVPGAGVLRMGGRSAGLETRDTADWEVCATRDVRECPRPFCQVRNRLVPMPAVARVARDDTHGETTCCHPRDRRPRRFSLPPRLINPRQPPPRTMGAKLKIFLSHNSADKPAVEASAVWLLCKTHGGPQ